MVNKGLEGLPLGRVKKLSTINDRMKYLRVANGLKQEELADELGFSLEQVRYLEYHKKNIYHSDLIAYSKYFNVTIDWLVFGVI